MITPLSSETQSSAVMASPIVLIADHDDPDITQIYDALRMAHENVHWLRLGLTQDRYELTMSRHLGEVTCNGESITDGIVRTARRIVFRRWKVAPPHPLVVAQIAGDPQLFAEREWQAALEVILHRWWAISDPTLWSRDPRTATQKLVYLDCAERLGLRVPEYWVGTRQESREGRIISKSVGIDQCVKDGMRYATTRVTLPEMQYLYDARQPCPTLLQREVVCASEVRIGYAYGMIGAVTQTRRDGNTLVDIRYEAGLKRQSCQLDSRILTRLTRFASISGLNVFTADLLVESSGDAWLLDINPDGLFAAADDEGMTLSHSFIDGLLH